MKDILFNSIIVDFKRQNYIYNELALQPLSLESTFILSKENVHVNIDSIIEIEQEE